MSEELEILCVTMHQEDMSLYQKMHVASDMTIANQTDWLDFSEAEMAGHRIRMYSTTTRGVGINRNIALLHATSDICLLADDDIIYTDGYENKITSEFAKHPKADVIIFNIGTSTPKLGRLPTQIKKYSWLHAWNRNPYGAPRIAFRLEAIRKRNMRFTTFFGGGCLYPVGEDSIFISQLLKTGAKVLLSPMNIGDVSYSENSTSIIHDVKENMYVRGAMFEAQESAFTWLKSLYYSLFRRSGLSPIAVMKLINDGRKGYRLLRTYSEYRSVQSKSGSY